MTYTLGSITDLGQIISENPKKTASISTEPIIDGDSNETDNFDDGGAVLRITLRGTYKGTAAQVVTFVSDLLALINGAQYPSNGYPLTYVSDVLGTKKVKILDVDPVIDFVSLEAVSYTIQMVESSEVG